MSLSFDRLQTKFSIEEDFFHRKIAASQKLRRFSWLWTRRRKLSLHIAANAVSISHEQQGRVAQLVGFPMNCSHIFELEEGPDF